MPEWCNRERGEPHAPEVQTNEGHKAVRGITAVQVSDRRCDHTRLSIQSWNAGLKKGKGTNTVVGSCHSMLLQETESRFHEIAEIAAEQFHIHKKRGPAHLVS